MTEYRFPDDVNAEVGMRVEMLDGYGGVDQGMIVDVSGHESVTVEWSDGDRSEEYLSDMKLIG